MAPSGRSAETLAVARAIAGFRQMALTSTRFMGMPQNWWATLLTRRIAQRGYTREDFLQQPARPGWVLIPFLEEQDDLRQEQDSARR